MLNDAEDHDDALSLAVDCTAWRVFWALFPSFTLASASWRPTKEASWGTLSWPAKYVFFLRPSIGRVDMGTNVVASGNPQTNKRIAIETRWLWICLWICARDQISCAGVLIRVF